MKYSACGIEDMAGLDVDLLIEIRQGKILVRTLSFRKVPYSDARLSSWSLFVNQFCKLNGDVNARITYTDDEQDDISLGSDNELIEALKVAKKCDDKLKVTIELLNEHLPDSLRPLSLNMISDITNTTNNPNDVVDELAPAKKMDAEVQTGCEISDASIKPPNWFTTYMDQLKEDLVKDIKVEIETQMQRLTVTKCAEKSTTNLAKTFCDGNDEQVRRNVDASLGAYASISPILPIDDGFEFSCKSSYDPYLNLIQRHSPNRGSSVYAAPEFQSRAGEDLSDCDISLDESCSREDSKVANCSNCRSVISGTYYSCSGCEGYVLCLKCPPGSGAPPSHNAQHVVLAIRRPGKTLSSCQRPSVWQYLRPNYKDPETGMSCLRTLKPVKLTMDAEFLFDETVPDGSKFAPAAIFTKRWRVVNCGIRPWTNETTLRFLWGTKHFTPSVIEVPVPLLASGEEGCVEVQCTAPLIPGFYESHWSFVHKDYLFGHRIWCNIQVVNAVEDLKVSQVEDHSPLKCCERLSAEGFVDNVNVDLETPPMSSGSDATLPVKVHDESPTAIEKGVNTESDMSSIVSVSSCDDDENEFVVVPMPPCFVIHDSTETPYLSTYIRDNKSTKTSASSSVIFLASPDSDEAKEMSPVSLTDASDIAADNIEKQIDEEHLYSLAQTSPNNHLDEETGINNECDVNVETSPLQAIEGTKENSVKNNLETDGSVNVEEISETVVQILPGGLVSAAAMLLKGAKAAISNVTRSSPPREQSPQEASTTYDASLYSSLASTLYEMGFYNRQLNEWAIEKNNGELEKIVEELLKRYDNDWHSYRH